MAKPSSFLYYCRFGVRNKGSKENEKREKEAKFRNKWWGLCLDSKIRKGKWWMERMERMERVGWRGECEF